MYNLIFISGMTFLGSYNSLESCQHAIREIFLQKLNPAGQRLDEVKDAVELRLKFQKQYICAPSLKVDNK